MLPTAIVDAKMNLFEARHNKKRRQLILGEKLQKGSTRRNLNKVAVSNAKVIMHHASVSVKHVCLVTVREAFRSYSTSIKKDTIALLWIIK